MVIDLWDLDKAIYKIYVMDYIFKIRELNNLMDKFYNKKYFEALDKGEVYERLKKANEKYIIKVERLKRNNRIDNIASRHYIATTVGGLNNKRGVLGTSHKIIINNNYNKVLTQSLVNNLGKLGDKVDLNIKNNYYNRNNIVVNQEIEKKWSVIGKCAEVKVADNFLRRQHNLNNNLQNINFTKALRPRTQEEYKEIKPCHNCQIIFYGK